MNQSGSRLQVKRGTRAKVDAAAVRGELLQGEPLLITDEGRLAVATSTTSYEPVAKQSEVIKDSFKNKIINGNFDIWQRGTSFTTGNIYTADRWKAAGATGQTVTRFADHPEAGVDGFCLRIVNTSGTQWLYNYIEAIEATKLVGKSITLSFMAKGTSAGGVSAAIRYANARNNFSTMTAMTTTSNSQTLSSSEWRKFVFKVASVPSAAANGIAVQLISSSGAGGAGDVLFSQVQLEVGSTESSFEYTPIAIELIRAQRFYWRWTATAIAQTLGSGYNNTTTAAQINVDLPVEMVDVVHTLDTSGTAGDYAVLRLNATTTCSAVPAIISTGKKSVRLTLTVASGLTAGQGSMLYAVNTNARLGFSADIG